MTRYRALLVGASEYVERHIQDLPFVPDDLQRIRDALVARGFHSVDMVESKFGITPNTVNRRVSEFLLTAGNGDTLVVLLSGHGLHFKGKDYLIPEDAEFGVHPIAESCIEIGWERDLDRSPAAHIVFLIDACREGIDHDSMALSADKPWSRRQIDAALRRKVAYVYACSASQLALFVRASDTVKPGHDLGDGSEARTGESFSLFSRALADVIHADPHGLQLRGFHERVQARVEELHTAYGKSGPAQRVSVTTDSDATDFPLLPSSAPPTTDHPWIRAVDEHHLWNRTPEGTARDALRQACGAMAGRLAAAHVAARRDLGADPWYDGELVPRVHARLGYLISRLAPGETLSPTETALAVLAPVVEETFRSQEAAGRVGLLTDETAATDRDRNRFRAFPRRFPRLTRRLDALGDRPGLDTPAGHIHWWLFHRWLIEQSELYTARALVPLLGDPTDGSGSPRWIADSLSAERFMRVLREHRREPFTIRATATATAPSGTDRDRDTIAASTADEHEVRASLVAALTKTAYAMAVDPLDLSEVVVEHVGIHDSVDLDELVTAVQGSSWHGSGLGRSLTARCPHPAVRDALRGHAARVDELLRDINQSESPALAPLITLPAYADGRHLRLDDTTADEFAGSIRFRLAEDRVQELLMGEQLYGSPDLAVRELYQNALDALRYRDCRTQYLRRTGQSPAAWEGRVSFLQGTDEEGRSYLECADNGVGMSVKELRNVFAQGGARFVDLPEYVEEEAEWTELGEPELKLYPNSRFGIGVLSYFMLADEIIVRTCRMGRHDGRPGELLEVTIAGPGNLFRVRKLGPGTETGTTVRLLLRERDEPVSCVETLRRVLWVAPFRTSAEDERGSHLWEPGQLSLSGLELKRSKHHPRPKGDVVWIPSSDPSLWWINHEGVLLADGLLAEGDLQGVGSRPYGVVVDLRGEHAPVLSVDRNNLRSFDQRQVWARMAAAAPDVVERGTILLGANWLSRVSDWSPAFGDLVAEYAQGSDITWRLEDEWLTFDQVGFFPPDTALLPLVTGRYPTDEWHHAASFFCTMPVSVLRWRLRALFRTGLGGPMALQDPDKADALCARPSDLLLLTSNDSLSPLISYTNQNVSRWREMFTNWLGGPQATGYIFGSAPSQALADTGMVSLSRLYPWREPDVEISAADVFVLSRDLGRPPGEVADRLTHLGYNVCPLPGGRTLRQDDQDLLSAPAGWLTPGTRLSETQVCVCAALAGYSTQQAARRLHDLGFIVPDQYPRYEKWADEESGIIHCLMQSFRTPPAPEATPRVSPVQLTEVAVSVGTTIRAVTELLADLGFVLPPTAEVPPEPTNDDLEILEQLAGDHWSVEGVTLPELIDTAETVERPIREIAARLRAFGYDVASVPDGDLPHEEAERIHSRAPRTLTDVMQIARAEEVTPREALARLVAAGDECTVTPEAAARLKRQDIDELYFGIDPNEQGAVPPSTIHAAALHTGQISAIDDMVASLTGLGLEVAPLTEEWRRERHLEHELLKSLRNRSYTVTVRPDDPPLSLVTLVVVALGASRALRDVALKATRLGMRHEIEDWFTQAPTESTDPSADAVPPESAVESLPGY